MKQVDGEKEISEAARAAGDAFQFNAPLEEKKWRKGYPFGLMTDGRVLC